MFPSHKSQLESKIYVLGLFQSPISLVNAQSNTKHNQITRQLRQAAGLPSEVQCTGSAKQGGS